MRSLWPARGTPLARLRAFTIRLTASRKRPSGNFTSDVSQSPHWSLTTLCPSRLCPSGTPLSKTESSSLQVNRLANFAVQICPKARLFHLSTPSFARATPPAQRDESWSPVALWLERQRTPVGHVSRAVVRPCLATTVQINRRRVWLAARHAPSPPGRQCRRLGRLRVPCPSSARPQAEMT